MYNIIKNRGAGGSVSLREVLQGSNVHDSFESGRDSPRQSKVKTSLPDGAREPSGKPVDLSDWRRQFGHFSSSLN